MTAVRWDKVITERVFHPVKGFLGLSNSFAVPILMYHGISNEPESGHPYFWLNTSPKRFAEQMRFLRDNNYKVIDLSEVVRLMEFSGTNGIETGNFVVLTFDDGLRDFLKHAWPVLADLGFTATVFVSTAFIGNTRRAFKGRECLTWSEIRELRSHGVTFGSHTVSHSTLYRLPWKEVRRELVDSRRRLEEELQAPALCFAYPYAFPREDPGFLLGFRQELADQGYLAAVTTAIGRARRGSDPLCLERLPVNEGDDERLFAAKLAGAYDWLAGAQAIARRTKFYLGRGRPLNA
jgi:peptidoglycan/xylan/chitin deacetylase (PgdA/CDA1 family)